MSVYSTVLKTNETATMFFLKKPSLGENLLNGTSW